MHIICADDAQEILHRSFEISNPNLNEDISSLLKKDNKWITWTDFNYKIILRLNKRSEQKDSEQKQRPISMTSFKGHLESEQCNISTTKPNWSVQISLIYMFFCIKLFWVWGFNPCHFSLHVFILHTKGFIISKDHLGFFSANRLFVHSTNRNAVQPSCALWLVERIYKKS